MYREIMDGLIKIHGVKGDSGSYAESLRPAAEALWQAYQSGSEIEKNAKYTDSDVSAAYLLRYFPYYAEILPAILNNNKDIAPEWCENTDVAFFGPGPAPELVGLANFFRSSDLRIKKLNVSLHDLNEGWSEYREGISDVLVSKILPSTKLRCKQWPFDFTVANAIDEELAERINGCELITFQNCINECEWIDRDILNTNICKAFEALRNGSSLIVASRGTNYGTANYVIGVLTERLKKLAARVVSGEHNLACYPIDKNMTSDILGRLYFRFPPLVDKLTLSKSMSFRFLIAKRK